MSTLIAYSISSGTGSLWCQLWDPRFRESAPLVTRIYGSRGTRAAVTFGLAISDTLPLGRSEAARMSQSGLKSSTRKVSHASQQMAGSVSPAAAEGLQTSVSGYRLETWCPLIEMPAVARSESVMHLVVSST